MSCKLLVGIKTYFLEPYTFMFVLEPYTCFFRTIHIHVCFLEPYTFMFTCMSLDANVFPCLLAELLVEAIID
jgi:hypothetical protein